MFNKTSANNCAALNPYSAQSLTTHTSAEFAPVSSCLELEDLKISHMKGSSWSQLNVCQVPCGVNATQLAFAWEPLQYKED